MGQLKITFAVLSLGFSFLCPPLWAETTLAPSPSNHFGITLKQFESHIDEHIFRVKELMLDALAEFSNQFEGVTPEMVTELPHDESKANRSPGFYAEVDYHNPLSISERLYNFFGTAQDAQGNLKPEAVVLIAELNRIDKLVRNKYFERHGMVYPDGKLKPIAYRVIRLEKIADEVDRVKNPVSEVEFGRPMIEVGVYGPIDPEDKVVANVLVKKYVDIISEHIFPPTFTPWQCNQILSHTASGISLSH